MQGDRSSRDVLLTLTLLDALLWRHRPLPLLCASSVHIGRLHRSRRPAGRSYKSRRALCAHGARCPASKGVRPPSPRCSRRPHRTFIYYTALVIVQGDRSNRDALFGAHGARRPSFWRQDAAAAVCSRLPHWTFTIPLSPSCRAIVQVETRSLCLDALLWRQAAAAAVLSPST